MISFASFGDEFLKLSAISREEAEASLGHLQDLESQGGGELARAAGVGAAVMPAAGMATRLVSGTQRFMKPVDVKDVTKGLKGFNIRKPWKSLKDVNWSGLGRQAAADAAFGAIGGGAVPALRHRVERKVEQERLKDYLAEQSGKKREKGFRTQVRGTLGV
jgi:hypothetical protein